MAQAQLQILSLSLEIAQLQASSTQNELGVGSEQKAPQIEGFGAKMATPATVIEKIVYWAGIYNVPPNLLFDVAFCESRLRTDAWNKSDPKGGAKSVFQFLQPTFDTFSKEMGLKGDIWNVDDNIHVASWAFKNGKESHWSCFNKLSRK